MKHRTQNRSLPRRLSVLMALGTVMLLSACGTTAVAGPSAAGGDGKVIAINFPGSTKNDIIQASFVEAKKAAAEAGYKVIIDDPGTDLNKQVSTLTTWIQQGVDVIIAQPIAPDSVEAIAAKAKEAGVGWVTYGVQMKNQNGYVGFDHMEQTESLVKVLADWTKKNPDVEPKIALLTLQSIEWARQREKGFDVALEKFLPDAKVVARQDALSQSEGLTAMSTVLQAHPDVNVVLAVEDTAAEGAFQALVNAGHPENDPNVFVGGMDGSQRAFDLLLKDSFYRGSAAIDSKQLGKLMVEGALSVAGGKNVNLVIPSVAVSNKDPRIDALLAAFGK